MTRGITRAAARAAAGAAEPLAWWATLLAGYLALVSTISPTEIVVGAAAAAAGAAAGVAARRVLSTGGSRDRAADRAAGPPPWAARLPAALLRLPPQIAADTARIVLRGGTGGRWDGVRVAPGPGGRGVAALLVSVSPGGFVGGVDPERRLLHVHRLQPGPSFFDRGLHRAGLIAEAPPDGRDDGPSGRAEGGAP